MSRFKWSDDKVLSRLLTNKSERTRWKNISVLRKRPSQELFKRCSDLIDSKQSKARRIGVDILAQFGVGLPTRPFEKQSISLFFRKLEVEKNPLVLMSLLSAIGHRWQTSLTKAQIRTLCSFSDTQNKWIKEGVVAALLCIDNAEAIDSLIKLSTDQSSHIRNWATFGFAQQVERNNKKIREALWARVDDKHQETRYEAIFGLVLREDKRVTEIIHRELLNDNCGSLLFKAIAASGDKQYLSTLRRLLRTTNTDRSVNTGWLDDLRKCIRNLRTGQRE